MINEWKDIPGYEGRYKCCPNGNIMSIIRNKRIMKSYLNVNGYQFICLRINGRYKNEYIHRLVAKTFIDNPYCKPMVNHINGVRIDNRISNLEWVTQSENEKHAYEKLGRISNNKGKVGILSKMCKGSISQFHLNGEFITSYQSVDSAFRNGFSKSSLYKVMSGKNKAAGGFIFKWSNNLI